MFVAKSKTVESFLQGSTTAWAKITTTTTLEHQNRFEIAMKIKLYREELHCYAFDYFTNLGTQLILFLSMILE